MSVPLIVHPPIQRVAILRMWISQVEICASVLDVYETFVVQMKEFLFIHCVFQRTWIPRVWTVIAVVLRKCHRVDFWARGVALRLVSFLCILEFVWVSLRVSSRCWLMRERGVCVQHFPQTGLVTCSFCLGCEVVQLGLKDVPYLSVFNVEAWQRRFFHGSVYCGLVMWI